MKNLWRRIVELGRAAKSNPAAFVVIVWSLSVVIRSRLGSIDLKDIATNILGVISLLAVVILIEQMKRDDLVAEVRLLAGNGSATKPMPTWSEPEVLNRIASARTRIDIVDTYYDEGPILATLVRKAIDAGARHLCIRVFMLSPDKPFGGQRLADLSASNRKKSTSVLEQEYRRLFENCVASLEHQLRGFSNVSFEILQYTTMPQLRLIAVDDFAFFFGLYPINGVNPAHVCFYVPASSLADNDQLVVEDCRRQLREIEKVSTVVYKGGGEQPIWAEGLPQN